jgi:hypothetical protein
MLHDRRLELLVLGNVYVCTFILQHSYKEFMLAFRLIEEEAVICMQIPMFFEYVHNACELMQEHGYEYEIVRASAYMNIRLC